MADKTLTITIKGDAKGYTATVDDVQRKTDDLGKTADDGHSRLGRLGDAIGGVAGVATIGLGALAGVGFGLKGAFEAADESAKIGRETERVIRTTGGAANITADQVGDLADHLAGMTGIDDEVVASAENLLLTFTNVKNGVGEGNDVFNQATGLALDMATALGTDSSDAALQLGKALNDPIKGITALSRAGVSFTAEQKEQIKALVASGDTLGAQKVILGELTKEFGGAAATAGTPLEKLGVIVGNVEEKIGGALMPAVEAIAGWLGENLPKAIEAVQPILDEVVGGVQAFFAAFADGGDEVTSSGIAGAFEQIGITARNVFDWLKENVIDVVLPALASAADAAFGTLQTAIGWLIEHKELLIGVGVAIATLLVAAFVAWAVSAGAAAVATIAATWPILAIAAAIALLVAGLIWAYNNWEWFRNIINAVVDWVKVNVPPMWDAFILGIQTIRDWIVGTLWPILQQIGEKIGSVFDVIENNIQIAWDIINNVITWIGNAFSWIKDHVDPIIGFFQDIPGRIGDAFSTVADAITEPFRWAFDHIKALWNDYIGGKGFTIPDWIPFVGGKSFTFPYLHTGGTFRAPFGSGGEGLAMLRDGEQVITPGSGGAGYTARPVSPADGAGGLTIYAPVTVQGNVYDNRDLAKHVIAGIRDAVNTGTTIKIPAQAIGN